jgi:lysophospholipase L1-like esterase
MVTRVSALGDSITAGSPGWDPKPEVRATIGDALDEQHQWPYWAERANPGIEIRNHGVNTERTDQILARLGEALEGADVLIVEGGINDVVNRRSPDESIANLRAMIHGAKEAGVRVAIANVLPWNNGFPGSLEQIRSLNVRIAELGAAEEIPLLDFYGTLDDPDDPGKMRPEWTAEGNHPSRAGHRRLGELAFRLP